MSLITSRATLPAKQWQTIVNHFKALKYISGSAQFMIHFMLKLNCNLSSLALTWVSLLGFYGQSVCMIFFLNKVNALTNSKCHQIAWEPPYVFSVKDRFWLAFDWFLWYKTVLILTRIILLFIYFCLLLWLENELIFMFTVLHPRRKMYTFSNFNWKLAWRSSEN